MSTRTRSSRSSASRTSRPGSSRASPSRRAARAPPSPRTSAPTARSPGSPAPPSWPLLLIFGTGLVHDLPLSTLAAIVIVAVLGFIDVGAARRLLSWRRSEFALAMAAFTGVAVLGVLWGVGIAIALSLLNFIRRAWRPHDAVLGRVDNLKGYHDTERYPDARRIPGLVLYRFDAPLFFAERRLLPRRVRALARRRRDAGSSWPPSRSPTSTRPPARRSARSTTSSMPPASSSRSRSSRTRCATGCAATASHDAVGERSLLPHHRRRRRRLPRGDAGRLARLGAHNPPRPSAHSRRSPPARPRRGRSARGTGSS